MRIEEIVWTEDTVSHIARHGVEPKEVEEACFEGSAYILKAKYNRYLALGRTQNGRCLTIVFAYLGKNKAKIITARAMSETERNLYKRR
ncbi:MAG: BrnT family toxin [Candidatus Omnitrophota bacterium]|nr:BrnT family toxin [Candidatus Omnitrophota bacterium]